MLQNGDGKTDTSNCVDILLRAQRVEHARSKSVATTDPINDAGYLHLFGLRNRRSRFDPGGEAVKIDMLYMARGRRQHLELRKSIERGGSGLTTTHLAAAGEGAAKQQCDVPMITENQIGMSDDSGKDPARIAIPPLPKLTTPVAVKRNGNAPCDGGLDRSQRTLRRYGSQGRRDTGQMQSIDIDQQSIPIPGIHGCLGEGGVRTVVDDLGCPQAGTGGNEIQAHPIASPLDVAGIDAVSAQCGDRRLTKVVVRNARGDSDIMAQPGELRDDIRFGTRDPHIEAWGLQKLLPARRR